MVAKTKFIEEDPQGYRINIIGRNLYVTDAMKSYAMEKLSKIDRFHNHVMDMQVTMDIQRVEHSVVILVKLDHLNIKVSASSTDMYASIDKAVEKLQSQLRRWKGRIQDHHRKKLSIVDMTVNVLNRPYQDLDEFNAEIEQANKRAEEFRPPQVIGSEKRPLKTLTIDEAVMKMDLSGDSFLVFRGEEDKKLKVLYRRNDGHFGMILPE